MKILSIKKDLFYWALSLLIGLIWFSNGFAQDFHLYLLTHKESVGDRNQVLGISELLRKVNSSGAVWVREFQVAHSELPKIQAEIEKEIAQDSKKKDVHMAISVGESGIEPMKVLFGIQRLSLVHLSHQILSRHREIFGKADFIFLPQSAVTESFEKLISRTRLLKTRGVFHPVSSMELETAYAQLPQARSLNQSYLGVILAGDAPTSDGKIRLYSPEEARKLARWIAIRAKKRNEVVLVLNGPRTGKYHPETLHENFQVHRDGKIDFVTQTFMKELGTGLSQKQVQLFNFQFGQASPYKAVLSILHKTKGDLILPGESVSMISESVDELAGQVIVYDTPSMNPAHQAYVQSEFQSGSIHRLVLSPNEGFKQIDPVLHGVVQRASEFNEQVLKNWVKIPQK